jgi:hypothetical protein
MRWMTKLCIQIPRVAGFRDLTGLARIGILFKSTE